MTNILSPSGDESIWVVEVCDDAGKTKRRDIFAEKGAYASALRAAREYRDEGFRHIYRWEL